MNLLYRFRSIFGLAGPHRGKLVLSGICAVLGSLAGLVPFILVAHLGGLFLEGSATPETAFFAAGLALGALLFRYLLLYAGKNLSHHCAYLIMYDLQLELARKIGRMPLGHVTALGSSTLKKTVLQDTDILHNLCHYLEDFLVGVTVPTVTLALFFYTDWRMALAAVAALPLIYAAFRLSFRNFSDESEAYFRADEHMQSTLLEYVNGISVVKTFNRDLSQRIRDAVDGQVTQIQRWTNRTLKPWAVFNIMADISLLFILPAGLMLVLNGTLAPETLLFFVLLGIGYLQPLVRLSVQVGFLNYASKSIERIESVLGGPELATTRTEQPRNNDIELKNVSFSYGDKQALKNINLRIPEGTICAIVGPSGAGKTTLAQLIGRFWDVQDGAITIGGADLRHVAEKELYSRISFVFQDVFLFNGTIAENLRLARPGATDAELVDAAKAARAHEFIMQMPKGYNSEVGEKGGLLSGGQKQRISIARAIMRDAPVLILDEATAYADPINEHEIQKGLSALMEGRTVIMIAHRLSTIKNAGQIVVLNDGAQDCVGRHDELLRRSDLYRKLWSDYSGISRNTLEKKGMAA